MRWSCLLPIACLLPSVLAAVENATAVQWRGDAGRSGAMSGPALASSWPKDGPPRVWTVTLPYANAHGSPLVASGAVYLATPYGEKIAEGFVKHNAVFCFDLETGAETWRATLPTTVASSWSWGGGTPALADGLVYATLAAIETLPPDRRGNGTYVGSIVCVAAADGRLVWQAEQDARAPGFADFGGLQTSPLVVGGTCIVAGAEVIAYDAATGAERWRLPWGRSYASPALARVGDRALVVCLVDDSPTKDAEQADPGCPVVGERQGALLIFCDLVTGAPVWAIGTVRSMWLAPTPVVVGDLLVEDSLQTLRAFRLTSEGPKELWSVVHGFTAGHAGASPLVVDGRAWIHDGRQLLGFALADGTRTGVDLPSGEAFVCPLAADGKLLYLAEDVKVPPTRNRKEARAQRHLRMARTLHLLQDGPEPAPLAAVVIPGVQACVTPGLGEGRLVVRLADGLACYDLRPEGGSP